MSSLLPWLKLHLAPKLTLRTLHPYLKHQTAAELCALSACKLAKLKFSPATIQAIKSPCQKKLNQVFEWLKQPNHYLFTPQDPRYPFLLKQITNPPLILYLIGDPLALIRPQLAIVGSRKATHHGIELSRYFTKNLVKSGFTITSGLAFGVDSAAHHAALDHNGQTIAVLGTGVDHIYPIQHTTLATKIQQNGAVISEFALGTPAQKHNFPQRNRIISGLSLGTLVIEATCRSGSLITAKWALEHGREVFAVPGSPLNPMSQGTNTLIQQGAKLCTQLEDITSEIQQLLPWSIKPPPSATPLQRHLARAKLDKAPQKLLECVGYELTSFEQLVEKTGFSASSVASLLCVLKLNGLIKEELRGYSRVIRL